MDNKKVKFDFFSIEVPNGVNLMNILDSTLPGQTANPIKYKGQFLRLENYSVKGNLRIGSATKINMDTLPSKAKILVPGVQQLGLDDDEGVANLTSFVIDTQLNILVLQRNMYGIRAGSFVHLIETLTGISGLALNIIVDVNTINKLNKWQIFSKFIIRVANPTHASSYKDVSVKESANIARHYNAKTIKMELGIGQGSTKAFLSGEAVKNSVKTLLKLKSDQPTQVESLVVRGKEFDDDKVNTLDLIKQKLEHEVDIPYTGRYLSQEDLEKAAWESYVTKEDELSHYKPL